MSPPIPKPARIEIELDKISDTRVIDTHGAFATLQIYTLDQQYNFIPYRFLLAVHIFFNGKLAHELARKMNEMRLPRTDIGDSSSP